MALRELLLEHADTRDLTKLAEYEAVGGYDVVRKALGMERQAVLDELLAADVRGRGGAGFPMGRKASFLPKPEDTLEADLPRRQRGRVRARHLQGPRDHAPRPAPLRRGHRHRLLHDRLEPRIHLPSRRVPGRVRGHHRRARGGAQGRLRRQGRARLRLGPDSRRPPRRGRVHLRRGDRPARVARGQPRPAAHQAAVPGHLRPLRLADADQQRGDPRDGAEDPGDGREGLRHGSGSSTPQARASSRSPGTSSTVGTTSSSWGRRFAS